MAPHASTIIFVYLAILSYFVHNSTVTISILILLAIKLASLAQFFPYVGKQSIQRLWWVFLLPGSADAA